MKTHKLRPVGVPVRGKQAPQPGLVAADRRRFGVGTPHSLCRAPLSAGPRKSVELLASDPVRRGRGFGRPRVAGRWRRISGPGSGFPGR